ncbi:hypothetical protein Hdeb2414_s0006g00195091 [Helianthus debilis subsp. tardiflorus]
MVPEVWSLLSLVQNLNLINLGPYGFKFVTIFIQSQNLIRFSVNIKFFFPFIKKEEKEEKVAC